MTGRLSTDESVEGGVSPFCLVARGESDPFGLRLCWLVLALGARLASDSGLLLGIAGDKE